MRFRAFDHVQLAMPPGGEDDARFFYVEVLGFSEIPKPANLAVRGGAWFRSDDAVAIHLGVDEEFHPATKAHPALICVDYDALLERLKRFNVQVVADETLADGRAHCYVSDPFGNRLEIIQG